MIQRFCFAMLLSAAAVTASIQGAAAQTRSETALDAHGNLNSLIARHAAANNLPEELLRRVIKRESRGNARAVHNGNYGLMQIRLGTARALGYRGEAAGLLDADTNMTYAVKYLAGAYQVAGGNHDRAVHYYAAGYYYAAKRHGLTPRNRPLNILADITPAPAAANHAANPGGAAVTAGPTVAASNDDEAAEASSASLSAIK